MYNELAISTLEKRLFWNKSQNSEFTIALDLSNATGTSGKHFQGFHNLVSIENVYNSVPDTAMTEIEFNAVLTDIRKQAVLQSLTDILDKNTLYLVEKDYSDTIINNASLFDNTVGYKVAVSVLEMFMSTSRINFTERNAKLAASNLKLELEGFTNENGHVVAKGIRNYYYAGVKAASKKLFPLFPTVNSNKIW